MALVYCKCTQIQSHFSILNKITFVPILTFNGRLSAISDAVGTPYWPGVIYIYRSACLSFFGADDVCFSWKPMQTHWGAHRKSGHSSGAITSFMAVLCSRLFMSRLDLRVATEGSAGQNKADHCTHVET